MKINLSGLVLLTGVPGSGKTLRMMQYLEQALAEGRPCYVCNIDGVNMPGVIPWDDPHRWQELPPRAVLFVDEAQRFFRARRGTVDPPESITAMETIRHDGVCIVMTTQQPTYLDKHIRGLIGHHEHLVEVIPNKAANVYTFRSCREEVTPAALADAEFELWRHPKHLYGAYRSAEVHTKKTRIPRRFVVLGVAGCVVVAMLAYAFWPRDSAGTAAEAAQAAPAAGPPLDGGVPPRDRPLTAAEYAARFLPRFNTMPISAPAYDEREVVAHPRIMCMASMPGLTADGTFRDATCTCLTEQGTRYELSVAECRTVARYGAPYDPYRAPEGQDGSTRGIERWEPEARPAAMPLATVMDGPLVQPQGDITRKTYSNP